MDHLALAVRDPERSAAFYGAYFGFDRGRRWYDEGRVLFVYDERGFALALGPWNEPVQLPTFLHFGVGFGDVGSREGAPTAFRLGRHRGRRVVGGAGVRERQVPRPGRLRGRGLLGA
jgi:catechol 2,3-dioxygenase-like lactoylglutathione lyase family enzyme